MSDAIDTLIDRLCEGQLDSAEMARLERLVSTDPEGMKRLVQALQMDGQLRWEFGAGVGEERTVEKPSQDSVSPLVFDQKWKRVWPSRPFATAAGLLVLLGAGLYAAVWMGGGQRSGVDLAQLEQDMAQADGHLREKAVARFTQHAGLDHADKVARILNDDRSPFVRAAAARGLGWMAAYDQKQPLLRALEDESRMVRLAAIDAIDRIAGVRIVGQQSLTKDNRQAVIDMLEKHWPHVQRHHRRKAQSAG